MQIECIRGPVITEVMGQTYRFDVQADGRCIAEVNYPKHIAAFLAVEHYRDADAAAPGTTTLDSIDPPTAELGSEDFVLHCYGSGFTTSSVIYFAENPEPIVFVSDTEVTTIVKPSLPWGPATVPVSVNDSAPLEFTFEEPEPEVHGSSRRNKAKGRRDD